MMPTMDTDWQETPDSSLGERDENVLQLIGQEELTGFTFDGLKRRLGLHPETLSRILYRLEDRGIVKKELRGYKVTSKIKSTLTVYPLSFTKPSVPILQTMLSPDVPVRQAVLDLRGKWFGMLRWLGYSENSNSVTLKWVTEDGGVQIDANFLDNQLSIEARLLHEKDLNVALKASYQLISHITRFYSGHIRNSHVAYPANFKPCFMLA